MVSLVIDKLKDDIEQLVSLKRMVDNVLDGLNTKQLKEIYIKSSEYSNGFYIQCFEPGFDECVNFIKKP